VRANQERTNAALTALGDPTRRAVLLALTDGPLSVGDLARDLPVTRPAVSQHLKVLKGAGLVTDEAVGTRRLYRIDQEGVADVRAWFDRLWTDALDSFKRAVEAPSDPRSGLLPSPAADYDQEPS
jgi:DNA-binding transcriptional ArsR family regulator